MTSKAHILVVDDDETTCEALKLMLGLHNYSIVTANDAYKALEVMAQRAFDIVLADLAMPGMDGLQLLEEIKKIYPGTPVVIITAYPATDNIIQALRNGASDFISKPYHPGELLSIVHREVQRTKPAEEPTPPPDPVPAESPTSSLPPAVVQFTPAQMRTIERQLIDLRAETNAHCVVLAESNGHVIDAKGITNEIDVPILAKAVSQNLTCLNNIASLIGEKDCFRLNYCEGLQYSIYSAQLQPDIFLITIFGLDSRCGEVLYAMRHFIPRLQMAVS